METGLKESAVLRLVGGAEFDEVAPGKLGERLGEEQSGQFGRQCLSNLQIKFADQAAYFMRQCSGRF